jgi:C4-dicarboxylate-specific signal transduction histidine kinase
MNKYLVSFAHNRVVVWSILLCFSGGAALLAGWTDLRWQQEQRLLMLQTEAERTSVEIRSSTLNSNLMGSVTLLGLIDDDIKQETRNGLLSKGAHIFGTLQIVGNAFDAEGVFVVGKDGIVKTSWDRANKPSTGLDVSFRPYYKMAIKGKSSIYAAVSMARGDRSLYFTVPVFSERAVASVGAGAVVARTSLARVDALLKGRFDVALLLSPQGVVFAGNQQRLIGMIDTAPDAQRLEAIRALKQFGAMFDKSTPEALPFDTRYGLTQWGHSKFAVASSPVNWNDPSGDWKLILMEDLNGSIPLENILRKAAGAAFAALFLGLLMLGILRSHVRQMLASQQLQEFARVQEASASSKTRIAAATVRLQRAGDLPVLMKVFLDEAHSIFGALQGVVYLVAQDQNDVLRLAGSYACGEPPAHTLALGEGLLGQCAHERRLRIISTSPEGFAMIRSGLGETRPACVLLAPILLGEALLGVVEVATLHTPSPAEQTALEELVGLLAMNIEIIHRSVPAHPANPTEPQA